MPGSSEPFDLLALDAAGRIGTEVPCAGCTYNLRGVSPDGQCPECGRSIGDSIHPDRLVFAKRCWLTRLRWGARLILAATVIGFVYWNDFRIWNLGGEKLYSRGFYYIPNWIHRASQWLALVSWIVGCWLVTSRSRESVSRHSAWWPRSAARWGTMAFAVSWLYQQYGYVLGIDKNVIWPRHGVRLILQGIILVGIVALPAYARRLAARMPDQALAHQTAIVQWGLGVGYGLYVLQTARMLVGSFFRNDPWPLWLQWLYWRPLGLALQWSHHIAWIIFGLWAFVLMVRYCNRLGRIRRAAGAIMPGPKFGL